MASEAQAAFVPPIVIAPHEWEQLTAILQTYLSGRKVWAFGSRATGQRVKRFSDLDLAIEGNELTLCESALLEEVLDESRLPFKVDISELDQLTPEFRSHIQSELVLVQGQESNGSQLS
jgi:predicted nucleotidyltransferase